MKDYGLEETAFVGDDINDLNVLRVVGFSACPADASEEVKQVCHYVSSKAGGDGAAREIIEYILKSVGSWSELVKKYEGASQ
jgi:3-deoxy-D-manno-octulosonate 8-phosphate phosphatase (KDO 8-P phosphatase)